MEATATQLVQVGPVGNSSTATGSQFLTFVVAGEEYGVDILKVQEIKGWTPVTRIPNTPPHVQGVLNLRGTIVPIIDMRLRFHMDKAEYTPTTVIIVLSVHTRWGDRVIGVVVDAVSDVLDVATADIKPAPDFGSSVDIEFISGLATTNNHMVMLLDIDRLLTEDELAAVEDLHGR